MDNKLVLNKKTATLTTATHRYRLPIETGTDVKRLYEAMTVHETSGLAVAILCAKVRADKGYRDITDENGDEVCPTFGEFAEKILDASKAYASLHANVGEVFADEISDMKTPWRYSQLEELLKLRKLTDADGNALTGADIIEIAEVSGITPKSTIREIREFIDVKLHPSAPADEDADEDTDEDTDEAGEDTDEDTDEASEDAMSNINELCGRIRVYATDKASAGMVDKLYGYLSKMYSK